MAFLSKSLSQDAVDRYCDTWACFFLLLLGIPVLFIPLDTSMTFSSSSSSQEAALTKSKNVYEAEERQYPKYKAVCWTPVQFTRNHITYTESVCSAAINSLAHGKEVSSHAGVYEPTQPGDLRPNVGALTKEDFRMSPDAKNNGTSAQNIVPDIVSDARQVERDQVLHGIQNLICFQAPLTLLVFAICLRLPHAIWTLLSTCFGCMNVDRTLAAAHNMTLSEDTGDNLAKRKELIRALRKSTKNGTSILYLLIKILMFAVLLVGFKVHHDLLVEIENLETDWHRLELMNVNDTSSSPGKGYNTVFESESSQRPDIPFQNRVLLCDFSMRVLTNVQHYTVQCLVTLDQSIGTVANAKASVQKPETLPVQMNDDPDCEKIFSLYKSLITIVVSLVIILAVLSLSSLGMWLVKLYLPSCRGSIGLKEEETVDVVFIVTMAWINTSPSVAMEIVKSSAMPDDHKSDEDALELI